MSKSLYNSVDLSNQVNNGVNNETMKDCHSLQESFVKTGIVCVKNPNITYKNNDIFTEMMEDQFADRGKKLQEGVKINEMRPDLSYQVGVTPEKKEFPVNHCTLMEELGVDLDNKPLSLCPPEVDLKWRYFQRIGEWGDKKSYFDQSQIIPTDVPDFSEKMENWGNDMLKTVRVVLEMLNCSMGLEEGQMVNLNKFAPNLLAPTGSDLTKYDVGSVFAGFHQDFNLLTIHGKSRQPGLFAWTKEGVKFPVSVPDGYLLIQAGKELEYLTGGEIKAGFHEVVYTESTKVNLMKRQQEEKDKKEFWRVSSTLFAHIKTDHQLEVLDKYKTDENVKKYPKIKVDDYIMKELEGIKLTADKDL